MCPTTVSITLKSLLMLAPVKTTQLPQGNLLLRQAGSRHGELLLNELTV